MPSRDNGKGAVLSRLREAGFRVPALVEIAATVEETQILEQVDKTLSVTDGTRFAVRSSASVEDGHQVSFAGLFLTVLNASRDEIVDAVRAVRCSLGSPSAAQYAEKMSVPRAEWTMNVIVQELVPAEVAGVTFSRHPSGRPVMLVEAAYGLGESIVSGQVEGDRAEIQHDGSVLAYDVGCQVTKMTPHEEHGVSKVRLPLLQQCARKMPAQLLDSVFDTVGRVQQFLGTEVDVEWAWARGELYLLQARPLTV
jgi:rifampicin phosphotransferase